VVSDRGDSTGDSNGDADSNGIPVIMGLLDIVDGMSGDLAAIRECVVLSAAPFPNTGVLGIEFCIGGSVCVLDIRETSFEGTRRVKSVGESSGTSEVGATQEEIISPTDAVNEGAWPLDGVHFCVWFGELTGTGALVAELFAAPLVRVSGRGGWSPLGLSCLGLSLGLRIFMSSKTVGSSSISERKV